MRGGKPRGSRIGRSDAASPEGFAGDHPHTVKRMLHLGSFQGSNGNGCIQLVQGGRCGVLYVEDVAPIFQDCHEHGVVLLGTQPPERPNQRFSAARSRVVVFRVLQHTGKAVLGRFASR